MKYLVNFSLLSRNRDFGALYLGQAVSLFGTMISSVALPYQVYHETHSTFWVGLFSLFQLLPLLLTALIGGVWADKYPRKKLLIFSEIFLAAGCILLALNSYHASIVLLFLLAILMSGINGLHRPALDGIVQQLVPISDYPSIAALNSFKFGVCCIVGPAVGGLLLAQFGIFITYLIDCFTFVISLLAICSIKKLPNPFAENHHSVWKSLKQGFHFAISRQELLGSYLVDIIAMIFGTSTALMPAIAQNYGGAKTLGLLYAMPAVGSLFISLFSGWARNIKRYGMAIALAAGFWGVAMIGFGLSTHHLDLAFFFLALAGALDSISGIFRGTLWNESIPPAYRGRLAGIEMISYLSGPKLGDMEAGFVAEIWNITGSLVSGGALCVLGVGLCCYLMPKFWNFRSSTEKETSLTSSI